MLPSDLQLMLKPDCKASADVITEKYSGVGFTNIHGDKLNNSTEGACCSYDSNISLRLAPISLLHF